MRKNKKQYRNEPGRHEPRKPKAYLTNIISLRISDQERKTLERLTSKTSKNISEIMREAMDLWCSKRRSLCLE